MADLDFLTRLPFAHRGLHGGAIVENTRAAFAAAIAAGHGIELDVQLSRDGEAFVYHDYKLDRLLDGFGLVADFDAEALGLVRYKHGAEYLSRLTEILAFVDNRVPVLIEIKAKDDRIERLVAAVAEAVRAYDGEAAVMSYRPQVSHWLADNAPDIVRGMVMSEYIGTPMMRELPTRKKRRKALELGDPQFLAFDIRSLPSPIAGEMRDAGAPILTWTVRTARQRKRAAEFADQIIYEEA
ncbi:MAG: glycerophosphodiester phosphodiesterase [Sphingomonadaceae bacterium]|nr:glycerophosphodiester phosphodiesterase [Sphingomonadaceae bacterium]